MSWTVDRCAVFNEWLVKLAKKFSAAEKDIADAFAAGAPAPSWALPGFKEFLWKTRIASSDLQRGKSGGFRVIYYLDKEMPNWCCLGACYFKGEREDISNKEAMNLLSSVQARIKEREIAKKKAEEPAPESAPPPNGGPS